MTRKKYYSVTEACGKLNVEPHVLRYWEKEFDLKIKRNSAGRRIYSTEQMERLQLIKHLIRRERLTVKGTKLQLARMKSSPKFKDNRQALLWLKKQLISIRDLLEKNS